MVPALLLALTLGAGAVAPPRDVSFVPVVGVGEPAPSAPLLKKLTELSEAAVHRAGGTEKQKPIDSGVELVQAARKHYFELDFKGALAAATSAVSHYLNNPGALSEADGLLTAHIYAALAQLKLGDRAAVKEHFAAVVTMHPDHHLPDSEFPPTAIAAFEQARDEILARRPKGTLTVSSSPAFARVRVDGRAMGESPLTVGGLLVGSHWVELSKDGVLDQSAWADVTESGGRLAVSLTPDPVGPLRERLAARIAAGAGSEVTELARSLAVAANVPAVYLVAAAREGQRFVVTSAWIPFEGRPGRAFTTLSEDLIDAPFALEQLARMAMSGVQAPVGVGTPPPPGFLDFERHFLGMKPPPPKPLEALKPTPEPEPTPLLQRPVTWVVAAGIVLAAGGATYFATRPTELPPHVRVTLELPQ